MNDAADGFPLRFDRLDRYVARCFLASTAVVMVFFFGFFMVIDLVARADEFVETAREKAIAARTMAGWVAGLYLYKAPSIFLQVAPFVTAIGGIVAVARLNRQNEIVPVLMSGRSVFRMLRPLFVCAAALTAAMLVVQEWVAPAASDRRIALYAWLADGRAAVPVRAQLTDEQGRHWSKLEWDAVGHVLVRARVLRLDAAGAMERCELAQARFDAARGGWTMPGGVPLRTEAGGRVSEQRVEVLRTSVTPGLIGAQEKEPFDLSFAELGELFGRTADRRFQVLLHYHVTFPLTNLLLLLLATPFVLRYDRQRTLQGFAAAFFLCVAYFGIDAALRSLGESRLHPVLAAWFAPLLFGALGISRFDAVRT